MFQASPGGSWNVYPTDGGAIVYTKGILGAISAFCIPDLIPVFKEWLLRLSKRVAWPCSFQV